MKQKQHSTEEIIRIFRQAEWPRGRPARFAQTTWRLLSQSEYQIALHVRASLYSKQERKLRRRRRTPGSWFGYSRSITHWPDRATA